MTKILPDVEDNADLLEAVRRFFDEFRQGKTASDPEMNRPIVRFAMEDIPGFDNFGRIRQPPVIALTINDLLAIALHMQAPPRYQPQKDRP